MYAFEMHCVELWPGRHSKWKRYAKPNHTNNPDTISVMGPNGHRINVLLTVVRAHAVSEQFIWPSNLGHLVASARRNLL